MNLASSDAMKTIPSATSSERPSRPNGTCAAKAALFSAVPVKRVNMPVSVGPGATAFTRIPDLAISSATDGLVDHGADVILLADVGVDEFGLRTERAQLLHKRLAGLITPTGYGNLRTLFGEGNGGGAPDAGQSAGDQDYWVVHIPILGDLAGPYRRSMVKGKLCSI